MSPGRQLAVALGQAPAALVRMSGRSWAWFALYFALAAGLLFGAALLITSHERTLERALMTFLFPREWHGVLELLLTFVFKAQAQQVVINVLLFTTLSLVSLVFFWAKESLSRSYEVDLARRRGQGDPKAEWHEHPIWMEALEEIKWTLVGVALMFVVLWVGHSPEPWRETAATVLSYAALFFTTAGNFLMPPMQRRRMKYAELMRAMFRRPLLAFGFGAAMSLPQVLVLNWIAGAGLSALSSLVVIFSVNIVFIAWAAVAGTHAGIELMPTALAAPRFSLGSKVLGWLALVAVLGAGTFVTTKIGLALVDKSQLLKCHYAVDWSSLSFEQPGLGGLLRGEVDVAVSFEVEIRNPNPLAVRIEKNRLVVSDDSVVVAESHLSPLEVPAGGTTRTRVGLDAKVRATSLLEGARLNPAAWDVTLYLDVGGGIEFPIYLRRGE